MTYLDRDCIPPSESRFLERKIPSGDFFIYPVRRRQYGGEEGWLAPSKFAPAEADGMTSASRLVRSVGFEKVEERPSARWSAAVIEERYGLHLFWPGIANFL